MIQVYGNDNFNIAKSFVELNALDMRRMVIGLVPHKKFDRCKKEIHQLIWKQSTQFEFEHKFIDFKWDVQVYDWGEVDIDIQIQPSRNILKHWCRTQMKFEKGEFIMTFKHGVLNL